MPSLGQAQIKDALATDTIKRLKAMTDEELGSVLGFDKKVKAMKASLEEADALSGKAREHMIRKLDDRLAPNLYGGDLDWMIRDAKREASPQKDKGGAAPACC